MITLKYYIPKYDWDLILFIDVDVGDIKNIIRHLHFLYADNNIVNKLINNIRSGKNCAITITNRLLQQTVISVNKTTSDKELVNSIVHEVEHLVCNIIDKYNIKYNSEYTAYLIGNIVAEIYDDMSYV